MYYENIVCFYRQLYALRPFGHERRGVHEKAFKQKGAVKGGWFLGKN